MSLLVSIEKIHNNQDAIIMPLMWKQFINAATMVFPLTCMFMKRRCKRKGAHAKKLLQIMKIHIPVSMMYHFSMFLGGVSGVSGVLRVTDFLFIHLSSMVALPKRHSRVLILTHGVLWIQSCIQTDYPLPKMLTITASTKHLLHHDKCVAKKVSVSGVLAFIFYAFDESPIRYGHAMFHMTLFWVYKYYFDLLDLHDKILL